MPLTAALHEERYRFVVEDAAISAEHLPRIVETFGQIRSAHAARWRGRMDQA